MKRADEAPEPSIDVDVDKKYIVELTDLVEAPSQWADAKEGDISLTWKYRMFEQDTGEAVIDANNGFAYELWQFSNDKTYRNVKSGKAAKAREWAEALIGKGELSDDAINELIDFGFAEALKGKKALADVEWYTTTKGYERLKIIRLRPFKGSRRTTGNLLVTTDEPRGELLDASNASEAREPSPISKSTSDRIAGELRAQDERDLTLLGMAESKAEKKARLLREIEENDAA